MVQLMSTTKTIRNRLDAEQLVSTIEQLSRRIQERFPDAVLIESCDELLSLGREAASRALWISQPIISLRLGVAALIAAVAVGLIGTLGQLQATEKSFDLVLALNFMEVGINNIVLLAAASYFLITIETRIKRKRALAAIHKLRSLAHIIDMLQLTKTPDRLLLQGANTKSSPVIDMGIYEMSRYLDYCVEMLSLTGKIAATYGLTWEDEISIRAANDVERLVTGLSQKIFQKIIILHGSRDIQSGLHF